MSEHRGPRRGVAREGGFDQRCVEIYGDPRIADDALQLLEWDLASVPDFERFEVLADIGGGMRVLATRVAPSARAPGLVVVFTVEGEGEREKVVLRDLRLADPD